MQIKFYQFMGDDVLRRVIAHGLKNLTLLINVRMSKYRFLKSGLALMSALAFAAALAGPVQAQTTVGLNQPCLDADNDGVNEAGDAFCQTGYSCWDPDTGLPIVEGGPSDDGDELCKANLGYNCSMNTDCTDQTLQECVVDKCVPKTPYRTIGTWCDVADHCYTSTINFELSCDADNNRCVGAAVGIDCSDAVVNTNASLGDVLIDVPREYRCDDQLVCDLDSSGVGECQQDFGKPYGEQLGVGTTTQDIRDQIRRLVNIALGFLGVAGVIVVIYGGALWMSAAGDDEKVEKAKKTIVSGLIGLVIIGIAWTIVSYVLSVAGGLGT